MRVIELLTCYHRLTFNDQDFRSINIDNYSNNVDA